MEHVGSAHDDAELELLKAVARQRLSAGQGEVELPGPASPGGGRPLPIRSWRMGHLLDALSEAYRVLGFEEATWLNVTLSLPGLIRCPRVLTNRAGQAVAAVPTRSWQTRRYWPTMVAPQTRSRPPRTGRSARSNPLPDCEQPPTVATLDLRAARRLQPKHRPAVPNPRISH